MNRLAIILIAAAALAACAPGASPPNGPPSSGAPSSGPSAAVSACGMERWTGLIGQPEESIPRQSLPASARVICAACLVTQDFSEARLNIILDARGRVASLRCG